MPTLNDVLAGSLQQAVQVQQIIDALKGTPNKGVPVAFTALNDQNNYALTVQNDDPVNSRALSVLKSDGTTLLSCDINGVTLGSPVNFPANSINGGTAIQAGSVGNNQLGPDVQRANQLVNGGFEIWQRGNGPYTATNSYCADRWLLSLSGTDTLSVSKDTVNVDTGSNACAACTFVHGTGTNTTISVLLKMADGYQLQGRTLSFSARVRCNTATAVRLTLAGDGTGSTAVNSGYHSGGGTYETLSAVGYVVPANATFVQVIFVFLNSNATAYLDNASVVIGTQPANYVPLTPAEDLARCLRYYEQPLGPTNGSQIWYLYGPAGGAVGTPVVFHVPKPVNPSVTKVGTWAVSNCGQPSVLASTTDATTLTVTATALGTVQFGNNAVGAGLTVEANP